MQNRILMLCLMAFVFSFLKIGNVTAGWQEASSAYKAGNYAIALKELSALTNTEYAGDAFYYLAKMCAEGKGIEQNMDKALELYYKAAQAGDVRSAVELGALYYSGKYFKQNISLAKQWFEYAASKGNPVAQYNLGVIYENGTGVPVDTRTAFTYYQKAANTGYILAQKQVGMMLYEGKGAPQDYNLALQYLTRAADQGDLDAQVSLARLLSNTKNRGAPINLGLAYKWYNIAAAYASGELRETLVKERDAISKRMQSELILAAQKTASDWKPQVVYAAGSDDEIVIDMQNHQDNSKADMLQTQSTKQSSEASSVSSFLNGLFTSDSNTKEKQNVDWMTTEPSVLAPSL